MWELFILRLLWTTLDRGVKNKLFKNFHLQQYFKFMDLLPGKFPTFSKMIKKI